MESVIKKNYIIIIIFFLTFFLGGFILHKSSNKKIECFKPLYRFTENLENKEVEINIGELYAKSAVLIDGDSGRVLFSKNSTEALPMASTTKIMTCILALENANLDDVANVSAYAASMPDVQLNIKEGESYYINDLLYSLMLESHNDTAVCIAENVSGSVTEFAKLMNNKAKEIGCENTYFITPNGLDAEDEIGVHSTTAEDLAKIMKYCIIESPKREDFLKITRTSSYSFSDLSGNRIFSCNNHNTFLGMMEGALSGKTGFTGDAGYCYVGALERDGKIFIVALLACGWPNNKSYKWHDTKYLMNYGISNYEYYLFDNLEIDYSNLRDVLINNGQTNKIGGLAYVSIEIDNAIIEGNVNGLLLKENEKIEIIYEINRQMNAPVEKGDIAGRIIYKIDNKVWKEQNVVVTEDVNEINFRWCFKKVFNLYFLLYE